VAARLCLECSLRFLCVTGRAEELRNAFKAAQGTRILLAAEYAAVSPRRSLGAEAQDAQQELREATSARQTAADNYAARRSARGTWATTLDRARAEFFTRYWDEIAKMDQLCAAAERFADEAIRTSLTALRRTYIAAYADEIEAMHAWYREQDASRRPPESIGNLVSGYVRR
jgi:hypothetical protein